MADKNNKPIVTRFAPSPTGFLHIGGLRIALYDYLFAKSHKGKFLLRIEDTDRAREVKGAEKDIIESLERSGLTPDGEIIRQSDRLDIYKKHAQELLDKGHAYYCFCSVERLAEMREKQIEAKQPPMYDGQCRNLNPEEAKKRAESEPYVIRMKMPKEGSTKYKDLIRGEVSFENKIVDDQVLMKSDSFPTYHLAAIVDDHLQGVTHVFRGEEWLPSLPKHIKLHEYFGWEVPGYAHMPLILNPDKSKLSKRKNEVSVRNYFKEGYIPEALINFLVLLGWNPGDDREIFTLDELVQEFSLERVHKAGAIFNLEKLEWLNNQHIKMLLPEDLAERVRSGLDEAKIEYKKYENEYLVKAVKTIQERLFKLSQAPEQLRFYFEEPEVNRDLLYNKKMGVDEKLIKEIWPKIVEFIANLDESKFNEDDLKIAFTEFIKSLDLQNGQVLWPVRVALTGAEKSPGVFEIMEVIGKDKSLKRLTTLSF